MQFDEAVSYTLEQVRGLVHRVVQGLEPEALAWRPEPQSNTIAWLLWHLTRIQDDHVSEIAGRTQVWASQGWAPRFGLPPDATDTGYGHTPEQVAAVDPIDAETITAYHDRVADASLDHLSSAGVGDFERIIDRSYDPPVTVGVRLLSVLIDSLQHAGQAAYVRGLWERREAADPAEVELGTLREELRSRVLAATAHAAHRRIRLVPDREGATYAVEAVSGDRLTLMEVSQRPDGSVAEATQSVTAEEVVAVHPAEHHVELVVGEGGATRALRVSRAAAAALLPGSL